MKHLLSLLVICSCISLSSSETICSNGFKLMNNGKCWAIVRQLKGYNDAEKICRFTDGAVVVQPQNSNDNNELITFLANANISEVWMGLVCNSTNTKDCEWDNADPLNGYNNFAPGSPNSNSKCISFQVSNQGKWVSTLCEKQLRFVCELPPTTKDCNLNCGTSYSNYCYKIYDMAKKYIDAEQYCELQNAHLVTIHNYLEWRFVAQAFRDQGSYWIGGIMNPKNTDITWLDGVGEDFAINNRHQYIDGICVQFGIDGNSLGTGWFGRRCDELAIFMCKRPAYC